MGMGMRSVRVHWSMLKRSAVIVVPILLLLVAATFAGCSGNTGVTEGESTSATEGGSAAPTPGATYGGPIEISGTASSAVISLVISADGASISSVGVTLTDLKTETFSAGSMTKEVTGNIPISDGTFTGSLSGLGTIEGQFITPTEASGKVKLKVEIPLSTPADLGEFAWTASAE